MFSNGGIKSRRSPHARDYVTGAFECAAYANRHDIAISVSCGCVYITLTLSLSLSYTHTHQTR